jgi:hypothetical protein
MYRRLRNRRGWCALRDYPNDPEVQAALAGRFDREPSDAISIPMSLSNASA